MSFLFSFQQLEEEERERSRGQASMSAMSDQQTKPLPISLQQNGSQQPKMRIDPINKILWATIMLVLFCITSDRVKPAQCEEQLGAVSMMDSWNGPEKVASSPEELVDTLKYLERLEKLDKYWSEVARPR